MKVLETERLVLRWLTLGDAEFILRLVNGPAWLQYIGDRGVKTLEDSRDYLEKGPIKMYHERGFGLYRVELKDGGISVGICGLIKRDALEDVDLGFALLPEFCAQGFALESASAVMAYGRGTLGMKRIVAVTSEDNHASSKLLGKLGFRFECLRQLVPGGPKVNLYAAAG